MKCSEWKESVEKSFDYLFTEFSFNILFCVEGERHSALLVAESASCRVRFMSMNYADEVKIDFGPRTAPLDWSPNDQVTTHKDPLWFSLLGLLHYLEHKPEKLLDDIGKPYENKPYSKDLPLIESVARHSRPHIPEILSFFTDENFNRFHMDYDNFSTIGRARIR